MIGSPAIADVLRAGCAELAKAGCDTPSLDAELLLGEALGVERAWLILRRDEPLQAPVAERFRALLARRSAREPVAYILGRRAFRHIELAVDRRVLVPRPESEALVEIALREPHAARVHDVGTGSGAIALAIKSERPEMSVSGSDISSLAIDVARANARALALEVELTVRCGLPDAQFDLVVANLPYVREDEWERLQPEIRLFEPRQALVAGVDGLDAIRALVNGARRATRFALEHAPGQAAAVRDLLADSRTVRDLAGRERVTIGWAR